MSSLFVILPAYNEEISLPILLKRFHEEFIETSQNADLKIYVVDDGSTDNTQISVKSSHLFASGNITLVPHKQNMGLAAALRTGLETVVNMFQPDDVVVTMDADDTHDPILIHQMYDKIIRENYDIIIASRFQKGGGEKGLSIFRKILSRGALVFMRVLFPLKEVRDFSCGYRAYRGSIIKKAKNLYGDNLIESKGFSVMAEVLVKMAFIGAKITEVPMVLRYERKVSRSKIKILSTIVSYFLLVKILRNAGKFKKQGKGKG